jgi:hypothetical protein
MRVLDCRDTEKMKRLKQKVKKAIHIQKSTKTGRVFNKQVNKICKIMGKLKKLKETKIREI